MRPNVKWHDGANPLLTRHSLQRVGTVEKLHPRGCTTFANLVNVETPDRLTSIFKNYLNRHQSYSVH
ncbi:MAG: hypothetical protein ACSLEN_03920 [Candidatus Malihini olakiniferum]